MTNARSDKDRWEALLDALSEDIANMPDEQLSQELLIRHVGNVF